eukprot:TRINITY_DN7273_c0_g1_i1.p1 TRINITY_DN7273_c0_g1~~TRINITY_DN7273_c0_g1_i1.p1  ORF type:complete len:490 (+),score=120.10 TRINITY_DN7273_c0_g1_i1:177-1472(+)
MDAAAQKVEEKQCKPPSPRAAASFVAHPTNKDEVILYGGEFNNGYKTYIYNDLFIYNSKKDQWRQLSIPKGPPPRSGHQAVTLARNGGEMYVFGGEFAAPNGSQFKHYNDLWVLNLTEKSWRQIDGPQPPPRSGHRMVVFRKHIVLFGGFQDDGKRAPKYFNSVHVFDTELYTWSRLEFPAIMPGPEARSACQVASLQDGVLVFGGYSRERVKGENFRGKVHDDLWMLVADEDAEAAAWYAHDKDDSQPNPGGKRNALFALGYKWGWQRVRPGGDGPSVRAGAASTTRSPTQMVSFGGVQDEETDDALRGQFYDDLYLLNTTSNSWVPLALKQKKAAGKKAASSETSAAADEPLWPAARMGSLLCCQGNVLYLYGGLIEVQDKQLTLGDLYSIDLHKMNEWKAHVEMDVKTQQWLEEESSSEEEDEDDDDE